MTFKSQRYRRCNGKKQKNIDVFFNVLYVFSPVAVPNSTSVSTQTICVGVYLKYQYPYLAYQTVISTLTPN